MSDIYYGKYIKYKNKYINMKNKYLNTKNNMHGGNNIDDIDIIDKIIKILNPGKINLGTNKHNASGVIFLSIHNNALYCILNIENPKGKITLRIMGGKKEMSDTSPSFTAYRELCEELFNKKYSPKIINDIINVVENRSPPHYKKMIDNNITHFCNVNALKEIIEKTGDRESNLDGLFENTLESYILDSGINFVKICDERNAPTANPIDGLNEVIGLALVKLTGIDGAVYKIKHQLMSGKSINDISLTIGEKELPIDANLARFIAGGLFDDFIYLFDNNLY
jgi:hypothetical protein